MIYIGHIPHGFYEEQMRGFFSQFGIVTRVRLSRSKKVSVVPPPPPPPPPSCTLSPLPSLAQSPQPARTCALGWLDWHPTPLECLWLCAALCVCVWLSAERARAAALHTNTNRRASQSTLRSWSSSIRRWRLLRRRR